MRGCVARIPASEDVLFLVSLLGKRPLHVMITLIIGWFD